MKAWYYGTIITVDREPAREVGPIGEDEFMIIPDPAHTREVLIKRLERNMDDLDGGENWWLDRYRTLKAEEQVRNDLGLLAELDW